MEINVISSNSNITTPQTILIDKLTLTEDKTNSLQETQSITSLNKTLYSSTDIPDWKIFENPSSLFSKNTQSTDIYYLGNQNTNILSIESKKVFLLKETEVEYHNKFVQLAKTKEGSQYFKSKLLKEKELAINELFNLIVDNIDNLITDQFGTHVIQIFVTLLNDDQAIQVIEKLKHNFKDIALSFHGSHCIQKLIQTLNPRGKGIVMLIDIIIPYFTNIFLGVYGRHIISRLLSVKYYQNKICSLIEQNIVALACGNKYANHQLQTILDIRYDIIDSVIENLSPIINNEYGRFLILYIIKKSNIYHIYSERLFEKILQNFVFYCCQQFSQTVIADCIEINDKRIQERLYNRLFMEQTIKILCCDKFGNHIIRIGIEQFSKNAKMTLFLLHKVIYIAYDMKKNESVKKLFSTLKKSYPMFVEIKENVKNEKKKEIKNKNK